MLGALFYSMFRFKWSRLGRILKKWIALVHYKKWEGQVIGSASFQASLRVSLHLTEMPIPRLDLFWGKNSPIMLSGERNSIRKDLIQTSSKLVTVAQWTTGLSTKSRSTSLQQTKMQFMRITVSRPCKLTSSALCPRSKYYFKFSCSIKILTIFRPKSLRWWMRTLTTLKVNPKRLSSSKSPVFLCLKSWASSTKIRWSLPNNNYLFLMNLIHFKSTNPLSWWVW